MGRFSLGLMLIDSGVGRPRSPQGDNAKSGVLFASGAGWWCVGGWGGLPRERFFFFFAEATRTEKPAIRLPSRAPSLRFITALTRYPQPNACPSSTRRRLHAHIMRQACRTIRPFSRDLCLKMVACGVVAPRQWQRPISPDGLRANIALVSAASQSRRPAATVPRCHGASARRCCP